MKLSPGSSSASKAKLDLVIVDGTTWPTIARDLLDHRLHGGSYFFLLSHLHVNSCTFSLLIQFFFFFYLFHSYTFLRSTFVQQ